MNDSTANVSHWQTLLDSAGRNDGKRFQLLAEPYQREIQVHCYRMLGSLQDAEDIAQETLLRAWRGLDHFEGRSSFRSWLYRIATNACLNVLAKRASERRTLPETQGAPFDASHLPEGAPPTEMAWLEPYPDAALEGIPDDTPGPDACYELQESVQLAFVAAIQHLPPRQRAVLLLRDVLGWSANETAELLNTSVASANSALQRARAALGKQFPTGQPTVLPAPDEQQRALLDRYVQTWEGADLDAFVALLREDATLSMPPWPHWYRGRAAIRAFYRWAWEKDSGESLPAQRPLSVPGTFRLVPTAANGQPAFAMYRRDPEGSIWHGHAILVLTLQGASISAMTAFVRPVGPRLVAAFGLPTTLPSEAVGASSAAHD